MRIDANEIVVANERTKEFSVLAEPSNTEVSRGPLFATSSTSTQLNSTRLGSTHKLTLFLWCFILFTKPRCLNGGGRLQIAAANVNYMVWFPRCRAEQSWTEAEKLEEKENPSKSVICSQIKKLHILRSSSSSSWVVVVVSKSSERANELVKKKKDFSTHLVWLLKAWSSAHSFARSFVFVLILRS